MIQTPDSIFARNFKTIREKLRLNQTQMGEFLGVTHQQIHKYETATTHIPMHHIHKIAHQFHLDYDIFFEKNPPEPTEAELSNKILSISDYVHRRKILQLIKTLVK